MKHETRRKLKEMGCSTKALQEIEEWYGK